jgi:hypothetical protein
MSFNPAYRRPALTQKRVLRRGNQRGACPITNNRGEKEYYIDQIVDAITIKGRQWYRVRWMGFGERDDTWESRRTLQNCRALDRWEYAQQLVSEIVLVLGVY